VVKNCGYELPTIKDFYDANPNMPFSRSPCNSKKMDNYPPGMSFKVYDFWSNINQEKSVIAPLSTIKGELLFSNRTKLPYRSF